MKNKWLSSILRKWGHYFDSTPDTVSEILNELLLYDVHWRLRVLMCDWDECMVGDKGESSLRPASGAMITTSEPAYELCMLTLVESIISRNNTESLTVEETLRFLASDTFEEFVQLSEYEKWAMYINFTVLKKATVEDKLDVVRKMTVTPSVHWLLPARLLEYILYDYPNTRSVFYPFVHSFRTENSDPMSISDDVKKNVLRNFVAECQGVIKNLAT